MATETHAAPARRCAYAVLRRVFERGAYTDLAFHAQASGLDPRDRALAMRLAYGTVQRKGTLDYLLERLAERPPARIEAPALAALRLGLYELIYLRGAPNRAVVADAVELAKDAERLGQESSGPGRPRGRSVSQPRPGGPHGLVNAVLRRGTRDAHAMLDELADDDPPGAAILHSHPDWIARMWWETLGARDARELMAADNEPSELALRVNTLRASRPELQAALPVCAHCDPRLPEALILEGPFDVQASDHWRAGAFVAQSRAAMLVSRALHPLPGQRILDLCAAPGGKSTHLAALMQGEGEVLAIERNARRAELLARTAKRLGADSVRVEVADARRMDLLYAQAGVRGSRERSFDRVLVDPPCSGLGTLQGHPDLRWRMTPARVRAMASEQAAILDCAASALRPGGLLVYSTCTISPTENERLICAFLDSHHDFRLQDLGGEWPDLRMKRAGEPFCRAAEPGRLVLTLPHRDRTAGFFIARLTRS